MRSNQCDVSAKLNSGLKTLRLDECKSVIRRRVHYPRSHTQFTCKFPFRARLLPEVRFWEFVQLCRSITPPQKPGKSLCTCANSRGLSLVQRRKQACGKQQYVSRLRNRPPPSPKLKRGEDPKKGRMPEMETIGEN